MKATKASFRAFTGKFPRVGRIRPAVEVPLDALDSAPRVVAVIPAFRAGATIAAVVADALRYVDGVVVVDDGCPEHCGERVAADARVRVVRLERNGGVGAATKAGFVRALAQGAEIIVKIDADGQMDASFVPEMVAALDDSAELALVKGNRFTDPATLRAMPIVRLVGNSGLTLLVKFSSGYWTIVDPTNGFIAVRAQTLASLDLATLADRYFFEIDLLCSLGLQRSEIAELPMPPRYGDEPSSLSISGVLLTFPGRLLLRYLRRLIIQYFVVELNVGSLCGLFGLPLLLIAIVFGAHEWYQSSRTGVPRATGTIILALLLFSTGFQLSLQALLYDVQFATRTVKLIPRPRRKRALSAPRDAAGIADG